MIMINKEEKMAVLAKYPDIGMVRTVKQKSKRHHYYMEERRDAVIYLRKLRGEITDKPKRNRYNNWKNDKRTRR